MMKDIIIPGRRVQRELFVYAISFVLAFLINITAVVIYIRPWTEVFSQIGYVLVISIAIYLLLWIPRLLVAGIAWLIRKKK